MIKIRLKRSPICTPEKHKVIVRSLGLKTLNRTVERPDTPAFRGMVAKIPHLLEIVREEIVHQPKSVSPEPVPAEAPVAHAPVVDPAERPAAEPATPAQDAVEPEPVEPETVKE
ncbi:MAG TPA: 50S ribosomal protein L30 [Bryobacteraceae bacterium]|nr:50S ribosomal protein L30 [Bryobacteraceae bacterium]